MSRHAADLPRVAPYRWYANCSDGRWRALRHYREHGRHRTRSLHHEILDAPPGARIVHRNGDGLDNRRGTCGGRVRRRTGRGGG